MMNLGIFRWKTSTIATASLFVSDAVMIKPDETAEEWTKRVWASLLFFFSNSNLFQFFVLCQYCRASGATHSVKSECELHPFSDVYERHLHVEEFDEVSHEGIYMWLFEDTVLVYKPRSSSYFSSPWCLRNSLVVPHGTWRWAHASSSRRSIEWGPVQDVEELSAKFNGYYIQGRSFTLCLKCGVKWPATIRRSSSLCECCSYFTVSFPDQNMNYVADMWEENVTNAMWFTSQWETSQSSPSNWRMCTELLVSDLI